MFKWRRKDPKAQLQADYERLLREARDLQRNGDIVGFSAKTAEADAVEKRIQAMEAEESKRS